ncbi:MAG: chloride channel protein, partial [Thiolinea sp.]
MNPASMHRVSLEPSGQSLDLWAPIVAALLAGGLTLLFVRIGLKAMHSSHQILISPLYRGVLSGVLLGAVFALHPFLRGAGYYELELLQVYEFGTLVLLLVALLKLAMTLFSVLGGWLGGTIFPLFFVGAALGEAVTHIIPGNTDATMLAAMTSAVYMNLEKPWLTPVLMLLLVANLQIPALLVGLAIGWLLKRLLMSDLALPAAGAHHH